MENIYFCLVAWKKENTSQKDLAQFSPTILKKSTVEKNEKEILVLIITIKNDNNN